VLALAHPTAFGKAVRIHDNVRQVVARLGLDCAWQYETAALLSQIGCVSVPTETLTRALEGDSLSDRERSMLETHRRVGQDLLDRIPRFASIARIVGRTDLGRADTGHDPGSTTTSAPDTALGGRILELAEQLDALVSSGRTIREAASQLRAGANTEDSRILDALEQVRPRQGEAVERALTIDRLRVGMTLSQDVKTPSGVLVVSHGSEITETLLQRLRNFWTLGQISESIRVRTRQDLSATISPVSI
jgi:hypothetical protein